MVNGLSGMIMDRKKVKELSRMGKKMDYVLLGIIMDRRSMKKLTRMGKGFLAKVGTETETRTNLTVFELGAVVITPTQRI